MTAIDPKKTISFEFQVAANRHNADIPCNVSNQPLRTFYIESVCTSTKVLLSNGDSHRNIKVD